MAFRDVGERKDSIDDGTQAALLDELHDLLQLGQAFPSSSLGLERSLKKTRRRLTRASPPVVCAASDQTASACQGAERTLEGLTADVLEDDVDAALASEAADLLEEVDLGVDDRRIGAKCFARETFFRGADRGEDRRAPQLGDLDGGAADA